MRCIGPACVLLCLLAIPASAGEPTGYRIAGGVAPAGVACSGDCGAMPAEGGRCQRLIDFLLYRPLTCKHCIEPAYYVPPLHAWFPNCCHANAGRGCGDCMAGGRGCTRRGGVSGGCSTGAASLGVPASVAGWNRAPRTPAPVTQAFAPPPVNSPYSPNMKSTSPAAVTGPRVQPTGQGGYRVQPTGYTSPRK